MAVIASLRLGRSNAYLLEGGDGLVLIDAGSPGRGRWEDFCRRLAEMGRRPEEVRAVLLTHAHADHTALAKRLQEEAGARVMVHAAEAAQLAGLERREAQWACAQRFLLEHGVPANLLGELRPPRWRTDRVVADGCFGDGDELAFGQLRLRAIHCPGHSPGSTVFFWDDGQALFSGDHVLRRFVPASFPHFVAGDYDRRTSGIPAHIRSLKRLRGLSVRRLLPGHGAVMHDASAAVEGLIAFHRARMKSVLKALGGNESSAFDLLPSIFSRLRSIHLWQGVSQVVGYLELLAEEEQVVLRARGDRLLFGRA